MARDSVFVDQPSYLQVPMKVPCFFRVLFGMCLYVQKLGVDVHILCDGIISVFVDNLAF